MGTGTLEAEAAGALELELQAVGNYPTCVLGNELRSCARVTWLFTAECLPGPIMRS